MHASNRDLYNKVRDYCKISKLNTAFKSNLPVLDAEFKPQSKNGKKVCLMHALIPRFLNFNAASQYKVLRYSDSSVPVTLVVT